MRPVQRRTRRAAVVALTVFGACVAPVGASAATAATTSSPGTAAREFQLPQRWNDDFRPGTSCATPGATGTYLTAQRRWFNQTDASSVANWSDEAVPVTHTVTDVRSQTLEVSAKVTGTGDLAKVMTNTFGFTYVHQVYWSLKQVVGPYTLPAGRQGRLVWGFIVLDADAQNVKCGTGQTWQATGRPYRVSAPEARYSELQLDTPDYEE